MRTERRRRPPGARPRQTPRPVAPQSSHRGDTTLVTGGSAGPQGCESSSPEATELGTPQLTFQSVIHSGLVSSAVRGAAVALAEPEPLVKLEQVCLDIPVEGVGSRSLKAALVGGLTGGLLSRSRGGSLAVQALSDLNFTIRKGERVALLGHNGAGKSTLLRLLSNIYTPTRGRIRRGGQVVPLINKSFWVDTDLSGRHAAKAHYLLNRNTSEGFDAFLAELTSFTELADFIHLPIRTYSEGMRTRLQFGLLTAFRHEALALDEGIGAGDQWFLSRARQRLAQFLGEVGTLILASHSNELLSQFCSRGLVLQHGRVIFDGPLSEAFDQYSQGVTAA